MTGPGFLERPFRILLAMLLGVVLVQTAPTGELPVQQSHGSAFSPATYDVALPAPSAAAQVKRTVPAPSLASPILLVLPAQAYDAVAVPLPMAPRQTGPPGRPPRLASASPRAPPITS